MLAALILLAVLPTGIFGTQECLPRSYGTGNIVCVCNSRYCDTISPPPRTLPSSLLTYTTNQAGLRFNLQRDTFSGGSTSRNQIRVNVNDRRQNINGWGGAFTDAAGINLASLDENLQDKLLRSYFAEDGLEYSLGRVPIAGTDFSVRAYSYDDGPPDPELRNFRLAPEDYIYKIPYITRALHLRKGDLRLFSSAWRSPAWMKTNGGFSPTYLLQDMYQPWANYFVKFLDEYQKNGLSFWGITTGNEPIFANSFVGNNTLVVGWNATDMGRWILNNLGPTLRNSKHRNINLLILDDQIYYLPYWVQEALENDLARQYVNGIAFHWYFDTDYPTPTILTETQEIFREKFILSTEACNGAWPGTPHVILGSWERGQNYSSDIIQDLNNWVTGWVDWNLALDVGGGPNYINNFVDAAIIVNASAGEFYKQPMYYHLGHFSKFIPRGSTVVGTSVTINGNVSAVAAQRPDSGIAVVILNEDDRPTSLTLADSRRGNAEIRLTEKSITTVLYW